MKKNKIKVLALAFAMIAMAQGSWKAFNSNKANWSDTDLLLSENVEALSKSESGVKCPNGCKDIGWGWNKILECDCNYDHFSKCNSWGC